MSEDYQETYDLDMQIFQALIDGKDQDLKTFLTGEQVVSFIKMNHYICVFKKLKCYVSRLENIKNKFYRLITSKEGWRSNQLVQLNEQDKGKKVEETTLKV